MAQFVIGFETSFRPSIKTITLLCISSEIKNMLRKEITGFRISVNVHQATSNIIARRSVIFNLNKKLELIGNMWAGYI